MRRMMRDDTWLVCEWQVSVLKVLGLFRGSQGGGLSNLY